MFGRDAPGFEELGIDWGPASPFGPDDDPGTPMTHQDSSESDELLGKTRVDNLGTPYPTK
jgi:hypothetical protein